MRPCLNPFFNASSQTEMFISQTDINYKVVLLRCLFSRLTQPREELLQLQRLTSIHFSHMQHACQITVDLLPKIQFNPES